MIKNFFITAFRNIARNRVSALINAVGLAAGLSASMLILLWVQNELNYENFNVKAENIYRVEEDQFYSGARYHVPLTPFPSGPEWKEKIPEIREQVRMVRLPRLLLRQGDRVFFESSVIAVDSSLFDIFTLPMIAGDPGTSLDSPNSIILTEKIAAKYFGSDNPIGKNLILENNIQCMVTGVVKDLPNNSDFTFEVVLPYSLLDELKVPVSSFWGNNSIFTYVFLENGADIAAVNKKLTDVVLEHNPETTTKFVLFPLRDIHLYGYLGYSENKGPVTSVYIFTLIAVFVLIIACINFINLSTAKASVRAKEIGIKKAAGAGRTTIFFQFMLESMLLVAFSLVCALVLVGLFLDTFNEISGRHFVLRDLLQWKFVAGFTATGVIAGILSGIYPAIYLSSFKPVAVLKGDALQGGKGRLRQILVVLQFALSILIATTAIFMFRQLKFLQEKDLGFDKENLICIPMAQNMKPKYYTLKKELLKETLIHGVTAGTHNPVTIGSNSSGARWEGKDPEKTVLIGTNFIDYDYAGTLKMKFVSGRDFSIDYPADFARDTTGNFLINEETAKIMDIGDPVGKSFRFMGLNGTIAGVMKNFHFIDADKQIGPIVFALTDVSGFNVILIRLPEGNTTAALKAVEKNWHNILPEYPLEYTFIDQDYDNLFKSQQRQTGLLKYFTILAVIIACLGLYGLSLYSAERRTNEVGIRKVMGAGALQIIYTLSKEFVSLVSIAIIIAVPAGWFIVNKLLGQFAYRVDMDLLVFAGISAGALIIAFFTVSYHAYRATGINPAIALKVE